MIDPALDASDMLGKIGSLPGQLRPGYRLGLEAWQGVPSGRPQSMAVAGMGASALGGDLLRTYLAGKAAVPVAVVRDYALPAYLGKDALVVVSSYSGDTEEALSVLREALARGARVACIASGGRLLDEARRCSAPYVTIPGGLPPRAGLGYAFSALLALASRIGLCPDPEAELTGCADLLENLAGAYSPLDSDSNPALALAEALRGLVPVIYGGPALEAVAVRWKNQFCENSKQIAFAGLLPEANHNEVMGWGEATDGIRAGVVVLRTADDHPAVARSLGLVRDVIAPGASFIGEFWGDGSSLLCRMFSLILLGDYASAYLALARGVDPTPIVAIDRIKAWLKEGREKG